ncbi:MAG: AMP-dependent synthetase, partial [Streptomycetaceae bacterium]|nr:AMP-dependent synthetase [Streptomycetaceae bacterium]
EAIAARLAVTNASLSVEERISRIIVADTPFSIENGLLTSQYKPKRRHILDAHHAAIHDSKEGIHAS